jgi:hypothetical protein
MKKNFWLWTALTQTVLALLFAAFFSIKENSYFIFTAAAVIQFALLQRNMTRYFIWFTIIFALAAAVVITSEYTLLNYVSALLWFFWIALFNFLIYNMLKTEQYEKLYFGSFILWIIAFGAVYAGMEFINILLLKIEVMPDKKEIAPLFMGKMRAGIIMGIALGLGYDIIQLVFRKKA